MLAYGVFPLQGFFVFCDVEKKTTQVRYHRNIKKGIC